MHILLTCIAPTAPVTDIDTSLRSDTVLPCKQLLQHARLARTQCVTQCCWVQSKSPQAVQPHLGKCFDGIRRLEFGGDDPKSPDILAMVSAEGEKVPLGKSLKVILCHPAAAC